MEYSPREYTEYNFSPLVEIEGKTSYFTSQSNVLFQNLHPTLGAQWLVNTFDDLQPQSDPPDSPPAKPLNLLSFMVQHLLGIIGKQTAQPLETAHIHLGYMAGGRELILALSYWHIRLSLKFHS